MVSCNISPFKAQLLILVSELDSCRFFSESNTSCFPPKVCSMHVYAITTPSLHWFQSAKVLKAPEYSQQLPIKPYNLNRIYSSYPRDLVALAISATVALRQSPAQPQCYAFSPDRNSYYKTYMLARPTNNISRTYLILRIVTCRSAVDFSDSNCSSPLKLLAEHLLPQQRSAFRQANNPPPPLHFTLGIENVIFFSNILLRNVVRFSIDLLYCFPRGGDIEMSLYICVFNMAVRVRYCTSAYWVLVALLYQPHNPYPAARAGDIILCTGLYNP